MINNETVQYFALMLERNGIPSIKVPTKAMDTLQQIDESFFATASFIQPLGTINTFERMQEVFDDFETRSVLSDNSLQEQGDNAVYFFACGMSGYGMQNWKYVYVLISKKLRLMISMPYGNAYADIAEEQEIIDYVAKFTDFCQNNLVGGASQRLSCLFTDQVFAYEISDAVGTKLYEGDKIASLLDILAKQEPDTGVKNLWIKA